MVREKAHCGVRGHERLSGPFPAHHPRSFPLLEAVPAVRVASCREVQQHAVILQCLAGETGIGDGSWHSLFHVDLDKVWLEKSQAISLPVSGMKGINQMT
jgi:hypothetical protein